MATHDANKNCEGSSQREKRCFDLFATLILAYGDAETRAKRGKEEQERNMLMIQTITSVATNVFSFGNKRKIDHESKNQENTASSSSDSSRSLVESKRRRVVLSDDEEPIRAEPIRVIKPPVRKRKGPVKRKEPVRREPRATPEWLVELMRRYKGEGDAKMIFEKVLTTTDLAPNQARLLMPFKQMSDMNFLTEAELKILEEHHKHKEDAKKKKGVKDEKPKGVDVILLNRNGNKPWKLNMRIWEMRSTFNYALCTRWNELVRENDLQRNQTITLWSFHSHDGTLYFAFDVPTPAQVEGMAPVTHAAASSSSSMVQVEDPFACEEANRRLLPKVQRGSRTSWVPPPTSDSSILYLEGGFDLNRTPPPEEDTEMDPDLETHNRWTSQEVITETITVDYWSSGCN